MDVKGIMEPKASREEMQELFANIEYLIDPVYDFGDAELQELREKIGVLKKHHGLN